MSNIRKILKDYFILAFGSLILAVGINVFLVPSKISTGGVSGIGTVLYYISDIPLSVTNLVINIALFIFGFRTLPKSSLIKTLAGIFLVSFFLEVTKSWGSYNDDMLIASIFGGILVGIGVGLAVYTEASTGGSDFAALMLHKLIPHISVASFILFIDSAIIFASGLVFDNYTIMLYSVISLYISSKVTDFILIRGDVAKSLYIISEKNEEIAAYIMDKMERGVTGIYSRGLYNGKDNMMLMCIVRPREVHSLTAKIKEIDKNAFTVISEVREVVGEGFKEI